MAFAGKMKIIYSNFKTGEVKVKAESLDDLWYLSNLIDQFDVVKGETVRKIKIGGDEERSSDVFKKRVFIAIQVEKVELGDDAKLLRILGKITEGPEDVPKGSHHSFTVEEGTVITIAKEKWLKFQLGILKDAEGKSPKILICVFDRENVIFAMLKRYGYEVLAEFEGDVQKKMFDESKKENFFFEIAKMLREYSERHSVEVIVLASPAFWKEDLLKQIADEELKKKIILATCSSVSRNAIDEVIKRPEVKEALKRERTAKEMKSVDELLTEIARDGNAMYGLKETEEASSFNAVKTLLITNSCIQKSRVDNYYGRIEKVLRAVDNAGGEIMIVSSEHDGGKKLDGLGGLGAITRYKMKY